MSDQPKNPSESKPPDPPKDDDKVVLVSTKGKTEQQIKDELYERCKKAGLIKE